MEGGRHRRHPRRPDRAEARQDRRRHRALQRRPSRRTPTTRSSSTGRPSSTAAPARSPRPPRPWRTSSATSRSRRSTPAPPCSSAAQSALAGLSLQTRDFDDAIRRFEELKRSSQTGTLSRGDRWKLITAYVNKGQWPLAKREIAAILNDAKAPPTSEERVRGANFYRQQGESDAALAQIDYVLKVEPTNPVGGRHALLHPAPGQAARPGRRGPAQGHRADGQGRQGRSRRPSST